MYANSLTSNSMNTQALAEAYITLINRIPGFENELNEFYDLSDGHIFSRLLVEIEKQITDLVRFCQAIFYVLFFFSENCPGLKLEFVTSNLPKSYQDLIARATNEITHNNNNNANNVQNVNPKSPFNNGGSNKQIEAIKLDYEKEIEELKKGYDRYFEEVQFLKNTLDETQTECKSLKQKLNDYEASLLKAGENSKTEHILKQEIDELRASLTFAEQKRHEAEMTISRQNADMAEQSRQIHTLNEKAQLADQLNEERREHRLLKDKLQRVENTNEKYKKSFEELVDYKKRFKSIKEENLMLLEDKTKLQRDVEKLTEFKVMSETYKEQKSIRNSKFKGKYSYFRNGKRSISRRSNEF
ncbi:hypothetical protein K502DRAFT_234067 [Neoconidiobolus thromboides FSU 785]|nr:hypothetical protein K502DRAFT_234067 [Neoconidiobolus thromboides FSU 785]